MDCAAHVHMHVGVRAGGAHVNFSPEYNCKFEKSASTMMSREARFLCSAGASGRRCHRNMWHISCATYAHMPAGVRAGDVHSNFDKREAARRRARRVPVACRSCPGVHARRARRAAASVAPAMPAVTAAPAPSVAPAPHTGIPTHRVSRDPPTSRIRDPEMSRTHG